MPITFSTDDPVIRTHPRRITFQTGLAPEDRGSLARVPDSHTAVLRQATRESAYFGPWTYVARNASRVMIARQLHQAGLQITTDRSLVSPGVAYLAAHGETRRVCDCPPGTPSCLQDD